MAPPQTADDGKRRDKAETRRKSGQHNSTERLLSPHLPFSATTQIDRVQPLSGLQQPFLFYCSRAHTHLLDSQEAYLHAKSSHSVPFPPHLEAGTTAGQRRKTSPCHRSTGSSAAWHSAILFLLCHLTVVSGVGHQNNVPSFFTRRRKDAGSLITERPRM